MPEISVIVPVYKAEAYLSDCVESLLAQTFTDFEIILVDDGSPDNCGSLCDGYAAACDRISVIHQENRGQSAARNHAQTFAKGKWICFVDSDDLIHPQMLELLYRAVCEEETPIAMCDMLEALSVPADYFRRRDTGWEVYTMDETTLLQLHDGDQYPGWVACAKLIRRDLIDQYPFREGRVYEDNEAVCRWICKAGKLAWIREDMYFYRGNPDSTTKRTFSIKRLDYLWALESIMEYYTSLGYLQLRQRFLERYVEAAVSCCNGVRYDLQQPEVVKTIEKQVRGFLKREKLPLTKPQFEMLLDAMHPKLIRVYWPVSGAVSTLREQGVSGIWKKLQKQLRKGDDQ